MKEIKNTKMELLTDLQYRYDQLKSLNIGELYLSDGKILDLDLTKTLELYEELMSKLVESEVICVDAGKLPEGFDIDTFIKEFKASGEWTQARVDSFIDSKNIGK